MTLCVLLLASLTLNAFQCVQIEQVKWEAVHNAEKENYKLRLEIGKINKISKDRARVMVSKR